MYDLEGCEIIGSTFGALHVETAAGLKVWIPRSQIESAAVKYGNSGESSTNVRMTAWIAKRKGLI